MTYIGRKEITTDELTVEQRIDLQHRAAMSAIHLIQPCHYTLLTIRYTIRLMEETKIGRRYECLAEVVSDTTEEEADCGDACTL